MNVRLAEMQRLSIAVAPGNCDGLTLAHFRVGELRKSKYDLNFITNIIALIRLPCGLALCLASAFGQDYLVKPVVPALTQDSNTTFLVDLTTVKTRADFASGNTQLTLVPAGFVSGGGYKGVVGFATPGNFSSNAWTLEMIIRLPYDASALNPIVLGTWRSDPQAFAYTLLLDGGWGVRTKLYSWDPKDYFLAQPYAGGDGQSIQTSGTDKWVYVAFGCDFSAQRCLTVARELTGDLLNHDITFAPSPSLDTNFLSGFAANQQPAELARRWRSAGQRFAQSMPPTFALGHPSVEIRAIRLSNRYRAEVFDVAPLLPQSDATTWAPQSLDATRARTHTVLRDVGYPSYNNFRTLTVNEGYLPLAPGDPAVSIQLTNVPIGLYSFFVYGAVDPAGRTNLARVWRPFPMDFEAHNAAGVPLAHGRMPLKQSFVPRRMQGFHFHVDSPGNVTATFRVPTNAMETAWIQKIVLADQLAGLPDAAVKTSQNIATGAANQETILTDARKQRDDAIWAALPPLNVPLQVEPQVVQFERPPAGAALDAWVTKAFQNVAPGDQPDYTFAPLDFLNTRTGQIFPQTNILNGEPWPGQFRDDGTGIFFRQADFPSLATDIYNTPRAELLGYRYLLFAGAIMDSRGDYYGLELPLNYFNSGDPNVGHDGAMALVRWAYDWPALEMNLHEVRLCTHSPDFEYDTDWSASRNGKMYYTGWSGNNAQWLLEAYDQVFPYLAGNQVFADAVHRHVPWVNTPQDVVRLLDRYLVFASVRDVKRGLIEGAANIEDAAGQVLGPSPLTRDLFDLTKQYSAIYPLEGTYQELYGTALSRSGVYYIGSYMVYAFRSAQEIITKAARIMSAKQQGVPVPMDLSDVAKYPKVRSAGNFLLDMWVAGGFPFMVGDASGGPHTGLQATNRLVLAKEAVSQAFKLYGDPRHAWVLRSLLGDTNNQSAITAAAGVLDPILHADSRVVPDYGAILELEPDETNILKKTSATLRLGIGQGHSHNDYLDLNLFGMGLPLAVDLACRNEGNYWSRPQAGWSFLHNHALAHDSDDPNGAGAQTGEPWLRAFAPPLLRASYVDQTGTTQLDRDVVLMQVGDTETYYAFDVQRLRGGAFHTWAFHGCESRSLQLNVPMANGMVNWTDRTLEGTQFSGSSSNTLQATWIMTRTTNNFAYTFNGGGTLHTVACEPTVLAALYNPALPEVKVRATLLGRSRDAVLQGNPYSDQYSYCFPFLWVQCTNEVESVYPAVYEWYRGNTSVVARAELIQTNPLQVKITTTTGQVDSYEFTPDHCLAVSRDSQGIRWAKLSGYAQVTSPDLSLAPGTNYDVIITGINYATHRLTTSAPLPDDPGVVAGNSGRHIFLHLLGSATSFGWEDDLLVQQGQITDLHVTGPDTIALTSDQQVFSGGSGNRKVEAMTVTTEDGQWHFRGGRVITKPLGSALNSGVFTDANGDGRVDMKTYEIGVGDHATLPVDITIQRASFGWQAKSNVPVRATINGVFFNLLASTGWLNLSPDGKIAPQPPTGLRIVK